MGDAGSKRSRDFEASEMKRKFAEAEIIKKRAR